MKSTGTPDDPITITRKDLQQLLVIIESVNRIVEISPSKHITEVPHRLAKEHGINPEEYGAANDLRHEWHATCRCRSQNL